MTTLYGINNCDTIKKVKSWLIAREIDFEFHDYKKAGCDAKLAKLLVSQFPFDEVINKRGTTWRKLSDNEKNSLNEKSAQILMMENPSIIKRPILQTDQEWFLGFDESLWQSKLPNL